MADKLPVPGEKNKVAYSRVVKVAYSRVVKVAYRLVAKVVATDLLFSLNNRFMIE